ncbi:MAG TPA: hypothetical protein VGA50_07330 [Kiloniellales bacterium]
MMRRAQAWLARMARQVTSRFRDLWRRSARDQERDSLASYSRPARRSNQPPYASLRQ